jgi:CRP/FNR family transcriptional regulator, anaerobic regulatory protein
MKRAHIARAAGEQILKPDDAGGTIYTLYDGWAARCRQLPNGKSQILDILLPGDLIGLSAKLLGSSGHAVHALTAVTLCVLDANKLAILFREQPELALGLLRGRLQEQERADGRLAVLGQMGATQRIGYWLSDLYKRLRERGLAHGRGWRLPLDRSQLADAVGLSRVHVMRALRTLREDGLADVRGRACTVNIPDPGRLARFSGYSTFRSKVLCPIL